MSSILPFLINDTILAELFETKLNSGLRVGRQHHKRIFLYRFDRQPVEGIVDPTTCFLASHVEVMTLKGNLIGQTYADLKALCFVSDNGPADLFDVHQLFDRRPKAPGLWTRFSFRDGSKLDGVLSHNLLDWPEHGYFITPPHAGPSRQRVFIPRLALVKTELRGVVGTSASVQGRRRTGPDVERQMPMFE